MSLLAELERRNVIRMAGLYLVGAWLIVQVAGTLLPVFEAPSWVMKTLVGLLAVGFVPALVFSWVFELTPEGIKRDDEVVPQKSIAARTARRMNALLIAGLVLALAYFGFDKFVLAPQRAEAEKGSEYPSGKHGAVSAGSRAPERYSDPLSAAPEKGKVNPRSVAVLPFVNMSTDAENEFFSDGLSEEILNSLARIDGMQVVGRTSSFQFKGKNEDLRTIGDKLGIASVLEGSVRREGDRARITAQLIRASDGIHLWSQTYDRTLKDTLAVQLDIAEQVAGVLDVVLDDKQRARMRDAGVKNVDAFIAYQKGLKLYTDAHDPKKSHDAIEGLRAANVEFDKATALEPDFSLAYYAASDLYDHLLMTDDGSLAERADAQKQALRILDLSATTSKDEQQRLFSLADRQLVSNDWHGLAARLDAALKQPGCNAPNWLPRFASVFGYADQIADLGARVSACDPLNYINYHNRITASLTAGRPQEALTTLAEIEKVHAGAEVHRIQALMELGRVDEAKALVAKLVDQNEEYYETHAIVGTAAGEDAASIRARLSSLDRSSSIYKFWTMADAIEAAVSGNRAVANRLAAELDARPGGGLMLVMVAQRCLCGAPFDLDATPNFKARLAESGLRWPPPEVIKFPARAQGQR